MTADGFHRGRAIKRRIRTAGEGLSHAVLLAVIGFAALRAAGVAGRSWAVAPVAGAAGTVGVLDLTTPLAENDQVSPSLTSPREGVVVLTGAHRGRQL